MSFALDDWLPSPAVRVTHERRSSASADRLWAAARALRVGDAALLGRLIRWRIPGTTAELEFDQLFRQPPFTVLDEREDGLLSGLVGRIWTLRRDYPRIADPSDFKAWSDSGTARVLFATWAEPLDGGGGSLRSEVRVQVFGGQGRIGLAAVRPLISGFHHLVGVDGIEAAVRLAEASQRTSEPRSRLSG